MVSIVPKVKPLRNEKGVPITCAHTGCTRNAIRVVKYPKGTRHQELKDAEHFCCAYHSRNFQGD